MPNIKTAGWSWRWRQIGCLLQQEKAKRVRFNFVLDPAFFSAPESSFLGIFFVLPCIESYQKVDLRTITLDVPPQEVKMLEGWRVKTFFEKYHRQNSRWRLCWVLTRKVTRQQSNWMSFSSSNILFLLYTYYYFMKPLVDLFNSQS